MRLFKCLLVVALFAASSVQAQKKLKFTPGRPFIGDTVHLLYHSDTAVNAVVYVYDTLYHWSAKDLPMKATDSGYTADVVFEKSFGIMAFKFNDDNDNDTGYILMGSEPGRQTKAAYAGYGLLRAPRYNMGVPGYFNDFNISDTAFYFWMGQEIGYQRGGARAMAYPFVIGLRGYNNDTARMARAAGYLLHLPDATDREKYTAALIYDRYLHNKTLADSIYPTTALYKKQQAYQAADKERDAKKRLELSTQFVHQYTPDAESDKIAGIDFSRIYRNIFAIRISNQDTAVLREYINTVDINNLALAYYKMVEIPYADWKTMKAAAAYPFSTLIMARLEQLKKNKPMEYWYYTDKQWPLHVDEMFANDYITHAAILKETGHTAEALTLANKTQAHYQYKIATLNELQAELLEKAGKKKELSDVLRNGVRLNQATPRMIDMLRKEYNKPEGFDAYFASLKDTHTLELMKEELKNKMISLDAAAFEMKDMNGKTISLAAQKGKVVVMDFWATWCAPCKAAMPGMKMAQEHFKNDTNVVFFYVDTQERIPDYKEKVKAFIKEKQYPFTVLFDNGEEFYSAYAKLIKTSGIPFKVIIDANGKLRFGQVGYYGSPSALADEISTMVELTKMVDK